MVVLSFLFSASFVSAVQAQEIFKCTDASGSITLSDKPCPQDVQSAVIGQIIRETGWIQSILDQKGEGIDVAKVSRDEESGVTTVEYYFDSVAQSNAFMEQAHEISQRTVRIETFQGITDSRKGLAIINIEDEKAPEPAEAQEQAEQTSPNGDAEA